MIDGLGSKDGTSNQSWTKQLQQLSDSRFVFDRPGTILADPINVERLRFLREDVAAPTPWLTVIPTAPSLVFSDADFGALLAARLLHTPSIQLALDASSSSSSSSSSLPPTLPSLAPTFRCRLCGKTPKSGVASHAFTCRKLSQWTTCRHDRVVDMLRAYSPPGTCSELLLAQGSNMRMDLVVPAPSGPLAVDVTIVTSRLGAEQPSQYFSRAAHTKHRKYDRFQSQGIFSSLTVFTANPFGSLSNEALAFLTSIVPDPIKRAEARTRVSVSIARATARMMQCWARRASSLVARD